LFKTLNGGYPTGTTPGGAIMKNIMWLILCVAIMCMGSTGNSFAENKEISRALGAESTLINVNEGTDYSYDKASKGTSKLQGKGNTLNTNTTVGVDSGSQQKKGLPKK
jgi:hypothetical protein